MAHPLRGYIDASGDSLTAFAERVGLSRRTLSRILSGEQAPGPEIARRIVEATGGSVPFAALYASGADVVDLSAGRRGDGGLNIELLGPVLRHVLGSLAAPASLSEEIVAAAAEAVANTHDALARVTTRRGADRLAQALRPVLEEIQRDFPALALQQDRLDHAASLAGELYYRAQPLLQKR